MCECEGSKNRRDPKGETKNMWRRDRGQESANEEAAKDLKYLLISSSPIHLFIFTS
ncbi:hypothetical protein LINPERPRIM_LOCUS41034 [Linum perenne]